MKKARLPEAARVDNTGQKNEAIPDIREQYDLPPDAPAGTLAVAEGVSNNN